MKSGWAGVALLRRKMLGRAGRRTLAGLGWVSRMGDGERATTREDDPQVSGCAFARA